MNLIKIPIFIFFLLLFSAQSLASLQESCTSEVKREHTYYVSSKAKDNKGNGSIAQPWLSINHAIGKVLDNSLILVKPGTYKEKIKITRSARHGITLRSLIPYEAKLTENQRVLALIKSASNIEIEGFEITHINESAGPVVVHIDGWGKSMVKNITLRNNIIHDSFNNDLLKINFGAEHITVICNLFYNQGDSDEHIDVNSAEHVEIRNNVFFNDYASSNREYTKKSSSYITIKDSDGELDRFLGAKNITVDGNIFFNWEGSHGFGFILIGEDGKPYFEAQDIHIRNNLLIGNSKNSMRSPFGVKGAKDIFFYNNTITGNLPSNAYAFRVNREGKNFTPENIVLYNNIWSDNSGTMGSGEYENSNDFSDTLPTHVGSFVLMSNIYWNGGQEIPSSLIDRVNYTDDSLAIIKDPKLPSSKSITTPIWNSHSKAFTNNFIDIEQIFYDLLINYGIPLDITNSFSALPPPSKDIRNIQRKNKIQIGAFQNN